MPKLSLKDQDVILVEPQGPMINVAAVPHVADAMNKNC